jgi:hypothetical protein
MRSPGSPAAMYVAKWTKYPEPGEFVRLSPSQRARRLVPGQYDIPVQDDKPESPRTNLLELFEDPAAIGKAGGSGQPPPGKSYDERMPLLSDVSRPKRSSWNAPGHKDPPDDDSLNSEDESESDDSVNERETLPWYRRPSPWWYVSLSLLKTLL